MDDPLLITIIIIMVVLFGVWFIFNFMWNKIYPKEYETKKSWNEDKYDIKKVSIKYVLDYNERCLSKEIICDQMSKKLFDEIKEYIDFEWTLDNIGHGYLRGEISILIKKDTKG